MTTLDVARTQYVDLHDELPTRTTPAGSLLWRVRGQNFTLEYCEAAGDEQLTHRADVEHVVLTFDDAARLTVTTDDESVDVAGAAFVVVPPGSSTVRVANPGRLVRLFDIREPDVAAAALNSTAYARPDPIVAPLVAQDPADRVQVHRLADHPAEPGRFGSIFRSAAFLVNFLDPIDGPRDPDKLSPHHHDDFEQCSLAVDGEWLHHIRTPWGPRSSRWRDDEHHPIGSPSVTIIPPPTEHTSEAVGPGRNRLVDIFCPPRADFAERGWVLNAAEYAP